jgi:predicted hydrocarbon binding protein
MNLFNATCIGVWVPLRTVTNMKDEPQNSHLVYLPNKLGRILLISYEEVIGQAAVIAVQRMAGVKHLIGNLPPNNLVRDFRFNDLSPIHETLERMYGPRAGRGIAMKTGQVCFKHALREFGPSLGVSKLAYRLLPASQKIEKGLQTFADLYNRYSNQKCTLRKSEDSFLWEIEYCPLCWERKTDTPCCQLAIGLLQEFLFWVSGGKYYQVVETNCIATGDSHCIFQISRTPLD